MEILTNTQMSAARRCPRQYFYQYRCGLVKMRTAQPLRFGGVFHRGLELLHKGHEDPINEAAKAYDVIPEWADPEAWAVERETVRELLAGHFWRYENDTLETLAVEQVFRMPMVNPDTGRSSRTFVLSGKIDRIVRLPDGRVAVLEYKTSGEDISPDSMYWRRLRYDGQISLYVLAARAIGFDVSCVLYDVTRKPEIRPCQVPTLDEQGLKVVVDAAGQRVLTKDGKPRQTGDSAKGYTLLARKETAEEFGQRLLADVAQRPDFYYARRELARTEDVLNEFRAELWQQGLQIQTATKKDLWFRNVTALTCQRCEYNEFCLNGIKVTPGGDIPAGFLRREDLHPELSDEEVA
jgi:RecB family exonuclease